MFNYLQGILAEKSPTQITLDVGGVGYEVFIPLSTYSRLPEKGDKLLLQTQVSIREDAHQIFGFLTLEEKNLFRLLIGVSGIGPKLALTMLSGLALEDLKRAIAHEDLATLTGIHGIGRKTAERIVIELREKILVDTKSAAPKMPGGGTPDEALVEDTILVLLSLGYKKPQAQDAIKKVLSSAQGKKLSVEELVRLTLKGI
ncbi:MAG TPA: Holliday junction branch migration protein RuvA [Candidatus Omnitrophota bacterium]|nr:Holliday junction branch migration protein RuvA [Candidatus Omnitrophota bacterium]